MLGHTLLNPQYRLRYHSKGILGVSWPFRGFMAVSDMWTGKTRPESDLRCPCPRGPTEQEFQHLCVWVSAKELC